MYVCAHCKCIHLAVLMPGTNAGRNWSAAASKAGTNFGSFFAQPQWRLLALLYQFCKLPRSHTPPLLPLCLPCLCPTLLR